MIVAVGAAVVLVLEQAVGVTKDPLSLNGKYPKQLEYSAAQVALFASGLPRQVLYDAEHFSAHSFGSEVDVTVGVGAVVLEQAVGVTKDPLSLNGKYPKQLEYSEAQVDRLASGLPRQVLYAAEQASEQASRLRRGEANAPVIAKAMAMF